MTFISIAETAPVRVIFIYCALLAATAAAFVVAMAFQFGQNVTLSKPTEIRAQAVAVAKIEARLPDLCDGQAWPHYTRDCLKETRPDTSPIKVISTRR